MTSRYLAQDNKGIEVLLTKVTNTAVQGGGEGGGMGAGIGVGGKSFHLNILGLKCLFISENILSTKEKRQICKLGFINI